MRWRDAVLLSLEEYSTRRATRIIQRKEFINEEMRNILLWSESNGMTPEQTLSRVFQNLRDEKILEFIDDNGRYLLLNSPINVEAEELTDIEIDIALRANQLKMGIVPTDNQNAIVRQRKGQSRLRTLTVSNYDSRCAVCDIADSRMLIASHIIGWAEAPEHRGDLSNVMCLCRIHDVLFEAGYWSLDDRLGLLKKSAASKTISLVLADMTVFRLPLKYPPSLCFVRRHREKIGLER